MAKSKAKQTIKAKDASIPITATKAAFDPTLSSLFASSVRAELFCIHEIEDSRLIVYTVGSSTSAAKEAI